ncbi:stage V sporulation protein S [Senimuribacter intestinalis]|uniref:stage V sporulation protein S n=1 Tax=Senimuribacter intestinalis TaxID=2941507 RepID=UPI00203F225C|nr:stage V sporulation protein S [Senimuribacter intestinalis]
MKVKANTNVNKLAGAIAGTVREEGKAELQAIGAAAVNQAVKAVITARGYLIPSGIDIAITPSFQVTETEGRETTIVHMYITPNYKQETKKENGEDGNH